MRPDMNTTTLTNPLLTLGTDTRGISVAGFTARVLLQLRRDFGLLRFGLLMLWCFAILQVLVSQTPLDSPWRIFVKLTDVFGELLAPLLVATCILADAPACSRAQTHTMPLGPGALWLAKLLMFGLGIALPLIVGDIAACTGFGYGWHEWSWFMAGDLLVLACTFFLTAAVTALADTPGRAAVYAAGTLLVAGLVIGLGNYALSEWIGLKVNDTAASLNHCRWTIGWAIGAVLGAAAWSVMTLTRHQRAALILLALAIVQPLLIMRLWHTDWHLTEVKSFTAGTLTLSATTAEQSAVEPGAQMLWKGLEVRGLPPHHLAKVITLTPAASIHPLPVGEAPFSYSDDERDFSSETVTAFGRQRTGVGIDQGRVIAAQYPPGLLWADRAEQNGRLPLATILQRVRERNLKANHEWTLLLQIQTMRQVADLPLVDLISRPHSFAVAPGLRWDVRPLLLIPDQAMELNLFGMLNRSWPSLAPDPTRVMHDKSGKPPLYQFQVVCRDMVKNECVTQSNLMRVTSEFDSVASSTTSGYCSIKIAVPAVRLGITGQTVTDWIRQARVQIWVPENAGLVELKVSHEILEKAK